MWTKAALPIYLLLRVLPVTICILGGGGYLLAEYVERWSRDDVQQNLDDQAEFTTRIISQRIDNITEQARNLARNDLLVNGLIDQETRLSYLPTFFQSLRLTGPGEPRIRLMDYRGREIAGVASPAHVGVNLVDWEEAVSNNQEVVSVSLEGLLVALPVLYHGLAEGTLVIDFGLEDFRALFDPGTLALVTAFVDDQNRTLRSSDAGFAEFGMRAPKPESPDWVQRRYDIPGIKGIKLITAERTGEAFATSRQVRQFVISTAVVSLLAVIGMILLTAYLGTREINKLQAAIKGVAGVADFERRIEVSGPAELRALGDNFNTMVETLQRTTTSKDSINAIIESLNEILIVTSNFGEIETFNPAAANFFESRGLGTPVNVAEVVRGGVGGDDTEIATLMRLTVASGSLERLYELDNRTALMIEWSKSVLRNADGGPGGLIIIGKDVTERYRLDKLKTEFISAVSHELRTPLTAIKGSLDLVINGAVGVLPEKAADMLKLAQRNGERLLGLIGDLLDIQKIETGGLALAVEKLELIGLVGNALQVNSAYADSKGVSFRFEPELDDIFIDVDSERLNQVLANLLSNAAKFSPKGAAICVRVGRDGDDAVISVEDKGPGIPADFHDRLFEKFTQADGSDNRTYEGAGLGLAISKTLVEQMGGEISFATEVGVGTTFFLRFLETAAPVRAAV